MKRGEEFSFGRDLRVRVCIVKEKKRVKAKAAAAAVTEKKIWPLIKTLALLSLILNFHSASG